MIDHLSYTDSDFFRGNHENTNSPYFQSSGNIDTNLLEEFVSEHLQEALHDHFFNEFSEFETLPYESLDWEDIPEEVKKPVVTHMVQNAREFCEDKYDNF